MEQKTIVDTGISLSLLATILGIFKVFVIALLSYVWWRCRGGWKDDDELLKKEVLTMIESLDSKASVRSSELFKRIEYEKDLADKKLDKKMTDIHKIDDERDKRLTSTLTMFFDKIDKQIEKITDSVQESKVEIAKLTEKANQRRKYDE